MNEIHLTQIIYDKRARNGEWCTLPYPNHPKGCPNFPWCPTKFYDFKDIRDKYQWSAVIEVFDLQQYALENKRIHPSWSDRQCRNLLYWQGGVRSRLRTKAWTIVEKDGIVLEIPEACGINVFETMRIVGIIIEKKPQIVHKIMLVGNLIGKKQRGFLF